MNRSRKFVLVACCVIAAPVIMILLNSPDNDSHSVRASGAVPPASYSTAPFQITIGPNVPHDVAGGKRLPPSEQSNEQLAAFAWEQFLALCWQSDYNTTNFSRGTPDTSWNYKMPYKSGQPLVWETYAHRSELRPYGVPLTRPFNSAPKYLIGTKIKPANGAKFDLFNNLDEDNEIGSCDVYNGNGDPATQDLIIYQAKVNHAEYKYFKSAFGASQHEEKGKLADAIAANIKSIKANRQPSPDGINLPAGDNSIDTVLGEGAVEIKTAFLRVTKDNQASLQDFFQTQAIFYTADYDGKTYSNWQYHNGTFALLGMHVIHKTKSYPDFIITSFEHVKLAEMDFKFILLTPAPPEYPPSKFNPHNAVFPKDAPKSTQVGDRQPIIRQSGSSPTSNGQLYPVPPYMDEITNAVHGQLAKINPKSVWLNYRLIGVQANITESWAATPSANAGPNHFMANHVIESDAFLGNFFGPGFGSNPFPTPAPDGSNGDNVLYNKNTYNMGGCKGCHGVAQTSFGTDFSFLLDIGQNKPVIAPDTIIYHPDEE